MISNYCHGCGCWVPEDREVCSQCQEDSTMKTAFKYRQTLMEQIDRDIELCEEWLTKLKERKEALL